MNCLTFYSPRTFPLRPADFNWGCKNKECIIPEKIFRAFFTYTGEYKEYCQEHSLPACPYSDAHTIQSSRQPKKQLCKTPANKIRKRKNLPSYRQCLSIWGL